MPSDDGLALRGRIAYEDLRGRRLIMQGDDFNACRTLTDRCLAHGFDPVVAVKTTEITFCLRLASMREGIAVVPDFIAQQGAGDGVTLVPFEDEGLIWEIGVISRSGSVLHGPYRQLADWLLR